MKNNTLSIFKGLLMILLSFTALSCSTKKRVESSGIQSITFGKYGGFSGIKKSHTLNLVEKELTLKNGEVKKTKGKDIKLCLDLLEQLDYTNLEVNQPHNMNKFIEISSSDTSKKLIWGDPSFTPPSELKELYSHLTQLVKK